CGASWVSGGRTGAPRRPRTRCGATTRRGAGSSSSPARASERCRPGPASSSTTSGAPSGRSPWTTRSAAQRSVRAAVPATRFTELVGCELPLQLAPMGTVGTPELVVAVANAGAHGMLAAVTAPPPVLRQVIDQIGWLTGGPFGINFLVPLIDAECVEIAAHG